MLLFCDSFDHYVTADTDEKWSSASGHAISAGNGRFSTASLRFGVPTFGSASVTKNLGANYQTLICGVAFDMVSAGASNNTAVIIRFGDLGTIQVDLRWNVSTGQLFVTRNGTTIATGSQVLVAGTYYFIEFKAKIDNTTGEIEVRIDGVTDITFSGDTQQSANAYANQLTLAVSASSTAAMTCQWDDLYLADDSGSILNDFIGDSRVVALLPNGNGTGIGATELTGSDGNSTDNYLLVDETAPNDDTDYVQSATPGDRDVYAFGNLTQASADIYGVQICLSAKKNDAGTRSIASVASLSGTEEDSADHSLGTAYDYKLDVREEKPGGGQWTVTDVNAAEFGPKVTA